MSSADNPQSIPDTGDSGTELNPLEGGRWRPVRPDELLRKNATPAFDLDAEIEPAPKPRLRLERRQELEHHLKSSPADRDAYLELGNIYRGENRPADAKRILQQAIEVFPDDKQLLWEYEEAVLARSLQQLREVTELAGRLNSVETDRELKRSRNDWACRRIDVCNARLSRDPSLVHLRIALGEAMYEAGMFEEAVSAIKEVQEIDELSCAAYLIRGRCLLELGHDVDAMVALRAASIRRSVEAPLVTRVIALRLLCETADRLGLTLTLERYRQHLQQAEQEFSQRSAAEANSSNPNSSNPNSSNPNSSNPSPLENS